MPTYSFVCVNKKCRNVFELFFNMSEYHVPEQCPKCKKDTVIRDYEADLPSGAVRKGDDEITVGHLASRNTDRFSEDKKESIWRKNHEYMEHPISYDEHKKAAESRKMRKEFAKKLGLQTKRKKNGKNKQ